MDLTKNEKWVKRVLSYFDHADMDHNGILQLDEVTAKFADILVSLCHPTDAEMAKYKMDLVKFYKALGVNKTGIKRADWPATVNSFAQKERQRIQNRK